MEQKRTNKEKKETTNYWKWAFLVLLAILIGTGIWFVRQLQPVSVGEVNEAPVDTTDVMTFSVATQKEDLTQVINQYIQEEVQGDNVNYQVMIDETFQLSGSFELFGFEIPFDLYMDPYVTENGNIQLRANQLSLGQLNVPISFAMNQMGSQLSIPDWVAFDGETETITFNLNEFQLDSGMYFSAERINLEENEILMNVYLPSTSQE